MYRKFLSPLFVAAALAGCGGETADNNSNTATTPNAPMHAQSEYDQSEAAMGHDRDSDEHRRMQQDGTVQAAPVNTGGNPDTAGTPPPAATPPTNPTPAPVATGNRDTAGTGAASRTPAQQSEGLTAQDQSNTEGDTRITQAVRQRVMAHDGLSMGAKNCTIVTRAGVVTLRGEVDTARERTIIGGLARGVSGVRSVEDQLVVDAD